MSMRVFDETEHQDSSQGPLWLSNRVFENKQENKKMVGSIPSPVKLKTHFHPNLNFQVELGGCLIR